MQLNVKSFSLSLTRPILFCVGSFSYTPNTVLCGEFLLHAPCCFVWGISLTRPMLFCVGSFSYTPRAVLCGEFLLHNTPQDVLCAKLLFHAPCCFMCGVSLTGLMLCYVGNFLHAPGCFMWGVSLTRSVLCYVGEFLLHALCCVTWGISHT